MSFKIVLIVGIRLNKMCDATVHVVINFVALVWAHIRELQLALMKDLTYATSCAAVDRTLT